jgi:pimeloyl-ACP methyl ester carboxylesterase
MSTPRTLAAACMLPARANTRKGDPRAPIECQSDIASALPPHLVRFERFPGCGHAVVPDAPERAFAVIQEFIAEGPSFSVLATGA